MTVVWGSSPSGEFKQFDPKIIRNGTRGREAFWNAAGGRGCGSRSPLSQNKNKYHDRGKSHSMWTRYRCLLGLDFRFVWKREER